MILVDTSIWADHFRRGVPLLQERLEGGEVLCHPSVIGELALGHLSPRRERLRDLAMLPQAAVVADDKVLDFIARERVFGTGIGLVDVGLMTSVMLMDDALLWTGDKRLRALAERLGRHAAT